jgi:hypothetical protein
MRPPLTDYQRSIAEDRIIFDHLLAPDLEQSLLRASVACAENGKEETGIIEFFCGLYLQYQKEVADLFQGDFAAALEQNFPKHRFGVQGLFPEAVLNRATSDDNDSGIPYISMKYSDELLRLLWLATTLANAVGEKASLKDVIAAAMQDTGWMQELLRYGLSSVHKIASFKTDIETVIFYATTLMNQASPKELEFEHDGVLQPPFTLEAKTPSGGFQPVRMATIKLNGVNVAEIGWPGVPSASVPVELKIPNKIEMELDGPAFGSVEVTVRGTLDTGN